ncbi:HAD-IA family hydrolase [Priestia flexa]|uniref:HAD-IA family hydrolase n=1 Tax=Priestia flexa TaxID=86664 RepID=UPI000E6A173F|nr:HAD-IA family hydrolase [Priestia flexa]MBN8436356.1 HAD-IA family hydrolase [Priestia flexa]MCA0967308.1 HAD-IA family hydrolase [Priestia flexa]RIV06898.1 HAD family hydrolase [Priestia flexa]UIR32086.1 HAD-IA family hydrolase [Priestia flexa]
MNILWDFDGTIFDTYPTIVKAFKKLVKDDSVTEAEILKQMKISSEVAIKHFNVEKSVFDENFHVLEHQLSPEDKPAFPHVEDVLKWADKNVIVTHKSRESTLAILAYFGMKDYFTEIITKDDGYKRKPDTGAYAYLHDKYHLDLVIGDRELDLKPARELGIKTCAFQNDALEADYHLTSYDQFFNKVIDKNS